MENLVLFKGHVGGITVVLDKDALFDDVLEQFKEKLISSKKFFQGASVNLHFKGRLLDEQEEERLLQVLAKQNIINISYIQAAGTIQKNTQNNDIQNNNIQPISETSGSCFSMTYFYHGVVRSGQHVQHNGSIVILGDVNPGAMVSAGGNIIILGSLRGKVHAGRLPQVVKPYIVAYEMNPSQITIGEVITQPPEEEMLDKGKNKVPQIAYLSKEQIYVEEIDYKTLNRMLE